MSRREKIILGLMAAAIIFGGMTFWSGQSDRSGSASVQDAQPLNQFISQAAAKLNRSGEDVSDYILKKAGTPLTGDPFINQLIAVPISTEKQEKADTGIPKVNYSGYIQAGSRRLAILNGMEYEAGDVMEPSGYVVKQVTPLQVTLTTPGNERLVVPISIREP